MTSYTYEYLELGDEHSLGCKCCRFSQGDDLPIPKKLSLDDISTHAEKFSFGIFADWTQLNAILKRFEATIQKRWLKKSLKQKREILLKAWPDIPTTHRPDFASLRHLAKKAPRSRTCPSAAYLWPYINLEDLQQHHLLLLFLSSRGRNLPEVFLKADVDAAHLGDGWRVSDARRSNLDDNVVVSFFPKLETGTTSKAKMSRDSGAVIISEDSDDCTRFESPTGSDRLALEAGECSSEKILMKFDARSPRSYGKLVFESTTKGKVIKSFGPIYGLLALEIQQGILSFLLKCTKLILHDIEPKQFFLAPHKPAPTQPAPPTTNEWPSLSAQMLEAPYICPQQMDLDRFRTLVASRRGSAEDHLWMLREDPGYFVETFRDWREHNQRMLKCDCEACWKHVAADMLSDAFTYFVFWDYIYRHMDSLPSIESQLQRADWTKMRLPEKEALTWTALLEIVEAFMVVPITNLASGVPPSPRMRHCYNIQKATAGKFEEAWNTKTGLRESENRVDMLFHALVHEKTRELHTTNYLVQEIQYMLDTDAEASRLVDSWIMGHFSDLALLSELKLRIEGLQPWSMWWKTPEFKKSPSVRFANGLIFCLDMILRESTMKACSKVVLLGDPTDGAFAYPVSKAYTESNVEQMRKAESFLDGFWMEMESRVAMISGLSIAEIISSRLLEQRELYRTPEWIPPLVPQKKTTILEAVSVNIPRACETRHTAEIETLSKPKPKIKTRGVPASATEPQNCAPDVSNPPSLAEESPTKKIKVAKRIYKVLAALLPESSAENHQRVEIAWSELLAALDAIGLQPEKLYGSVWIFKPRADGLVHLKRSIQFHEPKEVRRGGKIPPNMVRTFGRRLKHAYGWTNGMFVNE